MVSALSQGRLDRVHQPRTSRPMSQIDPEAYSLVGQPACRVS